RGAEWNLLHPVDGMPMEGAAERSAAKEYSARLSGAVELGWHVRAHPPRALCRGARAGRTWGSPTGAIIDSQTAKGTQKGGLGSILRATTRARRSKVASGTSWSTRWVSC